MSQSSLQDCLRKLAAEVTTVAKVGTEVPSSHPTAQLPDDPPAKPGPSAQEQSDMLTSNAVSNQLVDSQGVEIGKEESAQSDLSMATMVATPAGDAADPSVATSMKDPGTSHPASVGGDKYASLSTAELLARVAVIGNLEAASLSLPGKQAATQPAKQPPAQQQPAKPQLPAHLSGAAAKLASVQAEVLANNPAQAEAITAGYKFAEELGLSPELAQAQTAAVVARYVKEAADAADAVAAVLFEYQSTKQAAAQAAQAAQAARPAAPSRRVLSQLAGKRAEEVVDDSQTPSESEAGSGVPSGEAAPAGEMPPAEEMPPGDPMAGAMGGAPGGEDPLASMSPEQIEELLQILAALQESGEGPESLMGVGDPLPEAPGMSVGDKVASQLVRLARSGRYAYTPAPRGSAARKMREEFKTAMAEFLRRG